MAKIHATAIVDPQAELDPEVEVGAFSIIGPQVCIGRGTSIASHCVIEGRTIIGCDNQILQFNSLGCMPQDKKYAGENTALEIGCNNTIHEYCTLSLGTQGDEGVTRVGDYNWIMAYVHLAHDVQLGSQTILANNATLAGHVHVGDYAIIGGLTGVHQFVHIGAHAMIGFASAISQDVLPFIMVDGNPASIHGCNIEGLRRRGFSRERIAQIKMIYRLIYRDNLTLEDAKGKIKELIHLAQSDQEKQDIELVLTFLQHSTRGLVR